MRPILMTAVVLLIAAAAFAATPSLINYQGRLTTPSGTPVADGNYSVVFTIYNADVGGTAEWTETQSVTATSGLFAVVLGATHPITDTVFNGATRYLGTKVGVDPEMTPRVALITVPYAYRVSTLDGSSGGTISGNLELENSTATGGNIYKGNTIFLHNYGTQNTFVGEKAGNLTVTGGSNTATGYQALHSNTTGFNNTACGVNALQSNTTGYGNTSTGWQALYLNSIGSNNTANGVYALHSNSEGEYNSASGVSALYYNTIGNYNTACGYLSLHDNISGNYNTGVGGNCLHYNTIGEGNTAYGYGAMTSNLTGTRNVAIGEAGLNNNSSGNYNTAVGVAALSANTTGSNNTALGYYAQVSTVNLTNATAIGYKAKVDASNKIRLGNDSVTVIEGQVAYTFTSDKNQKEKFQPVDGAEVLSKIRDMSLTSWNYKGNDPEKFRHYGPVAQEFFAAFGYDGVGQCGDSVSINSGDMAGITLIAVQTLEKERELMKAEVAELRAENKTLHSELDDLKKTVDQLLAKSRQNGSSQYGAK